MKIMIQANEGEQPSSNDHSGIKIRRISSASPEPIVSKKNLSAPQV
jgi:hypothetical protein